MSTIRIASLLALLWGCGTGEPTTEPRSNPGQNFVYDHSVRIVAPTQGETLGPEVVLEFEAGTNIASVLVDAQSIDTVTVIPDDEGTGEVALTLAEGRTVLQIEGLDTDGVAQSSHSVEVRIVVEDDPWVSFTTPADGAEIPNPVSFGVEASEEIDLVEVLADDWSIGTLEPGEVLSYSFSGTGYARTIVAQGYDNGTLVATDEIHLTVLDDTGVTGSDWNATAWEIIQSYPTDGSYGYYWPSSSDWAGTTMDIWYDGELVAEGDASNRSYCVGLTWEVYMRVFALVDESMGGDGTLNEMTIDDLLDFRTEWYVRDLWGMGVVDALDIYGLGQRITNLADVEPGDPVQFWRFSGSGHNVYFVDWERNASEEIIGFQYWSTQSSTDGIGYNSEYFGTSGSYVDPAHFFVGRAWMPEDWLPWS